MEEEIAKNPKMKKLNGEIAFRLYDTFGFPLDLIEDVLHERGVIVDKEGFDEAMEQQKARGRAAWIGSGEEPQKAVLFQLAEKITIKNEFIRDKTTEKIHIKAIIKNGIKINRIKKGEEGIIITEQTPFYPEAGGQQGDGGFITLPFPKNKNSESRPQFEVYNTKYGHDKHFIFHHGRVNCGELEEGNLAYLQVDIFNRHKVSVHHSATHLLHAALRKNLGENASQKGSQITSQYLRFDFNHDAPLTEEDKKKIEVFVNARCLEVLPITIKKDILRKEAEEAGAIALFGEKYGEKVRVVTIGKGRFSVSVELCGGTHVATTAEIGKFHIVSESSVAAGIRRIEAIAGPSLVDYWEKQHTEAQGENISLREQNKKLQVELKHAHESLLLAKSNKTQNNKDTHNTHNMVRNLGTLPPKDLKPLADKILRQQNIPAIALAAQHEGKVSLLLALSPKTAQQHSAVQLLKPAQKTLQAKGGGKPSLAQIGSALTEKLPQALQQLAKSLDKI